LVLPEGYYASPKRIVKALEAMKNCYWVRSDKTCLDLMVGLGNKYPKQLLKSAVHLVKDDHGEILEGTFYAEEIQKVIKQDDVYKIQSVLKKRRKGRRVQYLVKWLGYVNNSSVQLGKYPFLNVRFALLSRTLSPGENLHENNGKEDEYSI
jgi:hypothetical protein